MYSKVMLLISILSIATVSLSQNFGYQGRKLELSVGTEVTTNPTYAFYARYGDNNDEQSGLGISFAPTVGASYLITKRFGLGLFIAKQNLFVGYRTPDAGSFNFSADVLDDDAPVDLYNIAFRITDKNRYRGLTKKEINIRFYVNKYISNASSYIQLGFGMYDVEADDNEVYEYGFYDLKGAPINVGDVAESKQLTIYEFKSNTQIPTFNYISFGYFFRKELLMDGLFVDFGITLAPLIKHSKAEETTSRGRSTFEYFSDEGLTDEAIEKYIVTNTWMYVRRQQGIKTHLRISYLF